jgi:hypothetical protein
VRHVRGKTQKRRYSIRRSRTSACRHGRYGPTAHFTFFRTRTRAWHAVGCGSRRCACMLLSIPSSCRSITSTSRTVLLLGAWWRKQQCDLPNSSICEGHREVMCIPRVQTKLGFGGRIHPRGVTCACACVCGTCSLPYLYATAAGLRPD